ncbi:HTH-type transcriptional regulator ImmR [compost metagenome]
MKLASMKYGALMKMVRERAGLSQEELAARMHRSQSCISKYEKDTKTPDFPTMLQWSDITGAKDVMVAFFYGMDGITIMQNMVGLVT